MQVQFEKSIRDAYPTCVAMLDYWHSLCGEKLKSSVEVVLADRHDSPIFKDFKGEIDTAYPGIINGQVKLVIYAESPSTISPIILSHEFGHWVLKLQGFLAAEFRGERNSFKEVQCNSLCHHRALYTLQRKYGIEPLEEIDGRAQWNIRLLRRESESSKSEHQKGMALLVADDLLSCSADENAELSTVLNERHPCTASLVTTILDTASYYDLDNGDIEKTKRFERQVIKKLRLSKNWGFLIDESDLFKEPTK